MVSSFVKCLQVSLALGVCAGPTVIKAQQTAAVSGSIGTKTVSIDATNAPLEAVLRQIARQVGLTAVYDEQVSKAVDRVTLHIKNVPAGDAFAMALIKTGLKASILGDNVVFEKSGAREAIQGGITGTVVDAKTKSPLAGVTLVLDGSTKGAVSANDGRFRFDNIAPGAHTIKVRFMGYVKSTKTVDVQEGQSASITIALEQSTNELDQVVVTGSVIPTERRAIGNAMTVITAKDIEARGITRLDQLFRGDIPGLFAPDQGNINELDSVRIFARGATNIGSAKAQFMADAFTNPVKTYLDGIELTSPELINQIDPNSIERIEVVTGPQAATTYGSNATNGVIQIFTKRGSTSVPKWRFGANTGIIQNSSRIALAPSHDASVSVSGMEGRVSYFGSGGLNTSGPWVPNKNTTRYNGNLGAKMDYSALSFDFTARQSMTTNLSKGSSNRRYVELCEQGLVFGGNTASPCQGSSTDGPKMVLDRSQALSQSLGVSIAIKPILGWAQGLTLGRDATATRSSRGARRYRNPTDTLLTASYSNSGTTSMNYRVNGSVSLGSSIGATLVSGVNTSQASTNGISGSGNTVARALAISTATLGSAYGSQNRNLNGFLQLTGRFMDNLFVTYGLSSEWNKKYADQRNPYLTGKYGVSLVREVGPITAKLRMSYGAATTPPEPGQKDGSWVNDATIIGIYGNILSTLPNPDLGPSYQSGTDGGMDLFFGNKASISITSYNQKVRDIIMYIYGDSAVAIGELYPGGRGWTCGVGVIADNCGPTYYKQPQYFNVANIRNQGYEASGNIKLGPLSFVGTYSWTKSRSLGFGSFRPVNDAAKFAKYVAGASLSGGSAEHTWKLSTTYSTSNSSISLFLNGVGQVDAGNNVFHIVSGSLFTPGLNPRLAAHDSPLYLNNNSDALCSGQCIPMLINSGYVKGDLSAKRRVSSRISANLNTTNLFNSDRFDGSDQYITQGRTVRTGFSLDL